jgi:UDPglucose--hexose-1-phosphate uridylyltransferase
VSELRADPLTGLRVLLAGDGESLAPGTDDAPPGWAGAVGANPNRDLFWTAPARGWEERLPFSPEATTETTAEAMEGWRERMLAHADAAYVHVYADLPGEEARLVALPFVPQLVAREREHFTAYATRTMGGNLLADLLQEEVRKRERIVAIDDDAVLMAPYGARVPYQLLLVPRRPRRAFEEPGPTGASLLADGLRRLEARFGELPPLSLWVRTAPSGAEHFCWRIDVLPRLHLQTGLELGTGLQHNTVAPEAVAAELREL